MRLASPVAALSLLFGAAHLIASGPLGIYAIVEKVVFEPNDTAPERIQVWGSFAYVELYEGAGANPSVYRVGSAGVSEARRGYMYFRLPTAEEAGRTRASAETIKTEWADLKAVAGTGQAVGFGHWGFIGRFEGLQPDVRSSRPPYILEAAPGNPVTDMRVRPASEPPANPALYQTNTGLVKLREDGSHADIVKRLKDALKR